MGIPEAKAFLGQRKMGNFIKVFPDNFEVISTEEGRGVTYKLLDIDVSDKSMIEMDIRSGGKGRGRGFKGNFGGSTFSARPMGMDDRNRDRDRDRRDNRRDDRRDDRRRSRSRRR